MIFIVFAFPKLKMVQDMARPLFKKRHFRTLFERQHGKESQTLVKYAWEHIYRMISAA